MLSKICSICLKVLPVDAFYAHPNGLFGRLHRCKPCHKAAVQENRTKNIDHYRQYIRDRALKIPGSVKGEISRKWSSKNKVKRRAQSIAWKAIQSGKLLRPEKCSRCNLPSHVDAHHENYYLPLDVTWLCEQCHGSRHREINKMLRSGVDLSAKGFEPLATENSAD